MLTRSHFRSKLKHFYTFSSPSIQCQVISFHSHPLSISVSLNKPYLIPAEISHSTIFYFLKNFRPFCSNLSHKPPPPLTRDGNFDPRNKYPVCPGCGIYLQDWDPKQPGFFIRPSFKGPDYRFKLHKRFLIEVPEIPSGNLKDLILSTESETGMPRNRILGIPDPPQKPLICQRCHSLRYYKKVHDPTLEDILPRFDFDQTVARRLSTADAPRTVVLIVVDATDFDGSFPKHIAKVVSDTIAKNKTAWLRRMPSNAPQLVIAVTKIDLLPVSLNPMKFEQWARQRAKEGGCCRIDSIHLVSPTKNWGLFNLVDTICGMVGERGHVWAVGSQNAGKSTLLNKISKVLEKRDLNLTEAWVPGTTLGILRFDGILPGRSKLFDTPGFLNSSQITSRLTWDENRLVRIRREMKPRTYRILAGYSIHIGALLRVDIEDSSVTSIYVTVWTSPLIPLHMGKIENADKLRERHFGRRLQPPSGVYRVLELGKWERQEFIVRGDRWDKSSTDISAAGLGWVAFALNGEAVIGVWTYDGIGLSKRPALLPHRARWFKTPGFAWARVFSNACKEEDLKNIERCEEEEKKKKKKRMKMLESDSEAEYRPTFSDIASAAAVAVADKYFPAYDAYGCKETYGEMPLETNREKKRLPKAARVDFIAPLDRENVPRIAPLDRENGPRIAPSSRETWPQIAERSRGFDE